MFKKCRDALYRGHADLIGRKDGGIGIFLALLIFIVIMVAIIKGASSGGYDNMLHTFKIK